MKTIVFKYNRGFNDTIEEEFEFEDDVKEEEIDQEFQFWLWQLICDSVTWYEKK